MLMMKIDPGYPMISKIDRQTVISLNDVTQLTSLPHYSLIQLILGTKI